MSEPAPVVIVIEDEPTIGRFVAMALQAEGCQVHAADRMQRGLIEAGTRHPDLVVLDLGLPDGDGMDFIRDLRTWSDCPIIVLSARTTEADKVGALDAGADDYLTKPFSTKELLARIRAVLRRKAPEALDTAVEVQGLRLNPATRRVTRRVEGELREVKVGPTEFRLLHFFMTHPERVHSRAQLLDRVWGDHVFIEERTVDVHVKRLREALAPADCAALIETVRGAGYRLTQQLSNSVA